MSHFVPVPPDKQYWVPSLTALTMTPARTADVAVWGMPEGSELRAKSNPGFVAKQYRLEGQLRYYHLSGLVSTDQIAAFLPASQGGMQWTAWLPIQTGGLTLAQKPPIVGQNVKKNHCWAAALYSWMKITGRRGTSTTPIKGYPDLVDQYADLSDDGISEKTFGTVVAHDFGMKVSSSLQFPITGAYIETVLKSSRAPLLLIFKSGPDFSHTVVVYGVSGRTIKCMDPHDAAYMAHPFSYFEGKPAMVLFKK